VAIGDVVEAGQSVGDVDGVPVVAGISGLLRGLVADGVVVSGGTKLGDVDPRGTAVDPGRLSDKARAVSAGVLEAVLAGGPFAGGGPVRR
jgi:xanthine dehydrogenase accessory factor